MKSETPRNITMESQGAAGANSPTLSILHKNVKVSGVIVAVALGLLVGRIAEVLYAL